MKSELPLAAFLVPETTIQKNGLSEPLELPNLRPLLLTLGILKTIEQESLLLSVEGSEDGAEWQPEPLATFPEKFYRGVSSVYIEPASRKVRYLRASWKVNRWGRGDKTPLFQLYLFVETA